jgi:hypoxanthine phosphoribosyltransferase
LMIPDSFPCELVTWHQAACMARTLGRCIRQSGFSPEIVVAIGRGGYVPARVVCDELLMTMLAGIRIEHWGIAARRQEKATVVVPLAVPVRDRRVLIVDDVTDTGETLQAAVSYIDSLGAAEIRTAVLQHKTSSAFVPDFIAETVDEVRGELAARYEIVADDEMLREAMETLLALGRAEQVGSLYRAAPR